MKVERELRKFKSEDLEPTRETKIVTGRTEADKTEPRTCTLWRRSFTHCSGDPVMFAGVKSQEQARWKSLFICGRLSW